MEGSDILQTIAEVSVALTGFTGIVVALGGRAATPLSGFALVRFRILLVASLLALGLALLPFFLHYLRVPPGAAWSICSAVVATIMIPIVIHDTRAFRIYADEIPKLDRQVAPLVVLGGTAMWFTQLANVIFLHSFAPFLAAPLWFLSFSAFQFSRLVLSTQDTTPQ